MIGLLKKGFPTGMIMRSSHDSFAMYQVEMESCILCVQEDYLTRPGLDSMESGWDIRRSDNPLRSGRNVTRIMLLQYKSLYSPFIRAVFRRVLLDLWLGQSEFGTLAPYDETGTMSVDVQFDIVWRIYYMSVSMPVYGLK